MNRSCLSRFAIAFAGAALLSVVGSASAQVTAPGNNKPLPPSAQKAPAHQQGNADLAALQADVAALKEQVRKLEGHLTAAEVQGGYAMLTYQTELGEGPAGNTSHLQHAVAAGPLTLNADGTMAWTGREVAFSSGWVFPATRNERVRTEEVVGTWTYAGGVLTLNVEGQPVEFGGGIGGRLFVALDANPADGTTTLIMLVKNP
jgi:hypothetical protein